MRLAPPLACAAALLLRLSGRRVGLVLVYHAVDERGGDPAREIVPPHAAAVLERQLRHLRRWYRVVDAGEIQAAAAARRRGGRFPVALTFDDDLRSHAGVSLPILRRLGLHATFFLSGASLSRPFAFWWERLQRAVDVSDARLAATFPHDREAPVVRLAERVKGLRPAERDALADALEPEPGPWADTRGMPEEEVRRLVGAGMAIGFHTRRHDPLDGLDDERLVAALRDGLDELADAAGVRVDRIAYPHGAAGPREAEAARAAGFALGFCLGGGPVSPGADPLLLPRVVPTHGDARAFALQLLRRLRRP